jgi:hypothetical protein
VQADLVARLRADSTLPSLVGRKNGRPAIDWDGRPDGASLPSVTLTDVSLDPIYTQGGREGQSESVVQVDVWGLKPLDCLNAINRIVAIMESEGSHGATFFQRAFLTSGPRGMRTEDLPGGQRVYRRRADLTFYHKPA